jgi:tRNA G18 (ribose-2'-O)-methylase SpoU
MDELERLSADDAKTSTKHPLIIILDDVRSMHNVGAAFRTADAFGVSAVYLCGYTPQPPHRDIQKTALGATESVEWQHFSTVTEAINVAREKGYAIVAIEQTHQSVLLHDFEWKGTPLAFVFGNEVNGVSDEALKQVDAVIEIPQWGAKHSLNISVSVGVVLWEIVRSLVAKSLL